MRSDILVVMSIAVSSYTVLMPMIHEGTWIRNMFLEHLSIKITKNIFFVFVCCFIPAIFRLCLHARIFFTQFVNFLHYYLLSSSSYSIIPCPSFFSFCFLPRIILIHVFCCLPSSPTSRSGISHSNSMRAEQVILKLKRTT